MDSLAKKPKILVILGPTATGKSDLAVELAKKFNGEIVSADSRQVYKGLDIGTGKITEKEMKGVPHHMLDIVSPKKRLSADAYRKKTYSVIQEILDRKNLPIICGGTGFYIQAIVDNMIFPDVEPDLVLRKKLAAQKPDELFNMLKKLDPERSGNIDGKNLQRLIRAIEIATALGKVPKIQPQPLYTPLQIGISIDDATLRSRIRTRLLKRMKMGMVKEAEILHKKGVSFKRMEELGLEYRHLSLFLQKKLSKKDMLEQLEIAIHHYAKRQKTWFKKDKRIVWIDLGQEADTESLVREFLH